jgi:hypothetical protein
MIDRTLVVGNKIFTTHRDRGLYLGTWAINQPRWLAEHPGSWRFIEDVLQEAALRSPPVEGATDPEAGPAEPTDLSSSPDFRKDGDEEDDVSLVDTPACHRQWETDPPGTLNLTHRFRWFLHEGGADAEGGGADGIGGFEEARG